LKLFLIMIMLGFVNCSTLFFKPETRVSPICSFGNEKIKNLDFFLNEPKQYPKNSKYEKLIVRIKEYEKLRKELLDLNITSEEITKTLSSLQDRMDAIRISLGTREEKEGDLFAGQYNFIKAIESLTEALYHLEFVDEKNKVADATIQRIIKKISVTKENGENFLNNRIKSLIDQAIYLNLDDQTSKAKEAMKQAEKELESSIFTSSKIESLYIEQAKVMNLYDKEIEAVCISKSSIARNQKSKQIPDSFKTKSGIEFTKIIRKDGTPVYVSESILPNESESWYFARNYADNLNKVERCYDCYLLPEFEDIENLKPREVINKGGDKEYENMGFVWLKSWSPGFFIYPFYILDFLHDLVTHPLTWQSYAYPLSPDSCYIDIKEYLKNKELKCRGSFNIFRSSARHNDNQGRFDRFYNEVWGGFRIVRAVR